MQRRSNAAGVSNATALDQQMEDCTQDCLNSHAVCLDTATRLLQSGGKPELVRLLLDCAEMCQTAAHFMIRNSPLSGYTCQVCGEICGHCEQACSEDGETDCANACRASANSCQQMVKMLA